MSKIPRLPTTEEVKKLTPEERSEKMAQAILDSMDEPDMTPEEIREYEEAAGYFDDDD